MSKYDILPFVAGFAVGMVAGWFAKTAYSEIKSSRDEINDDEYDEEEPEKVEDKVVITKVAQKPSLEEIKARMAESKEAESLIREEGYSTEEEEDDKIELITEDQFLEGQMNKEGLEYDPESNKVFDENGVEMEDWQTFLLSDMDEHFGYGTDDPNCVYIRNNEMGIDYEIVRRIRH